MHSNCFFARRKLFLALSLLICTLISSPASSQENAFTPDSPINDSVESAINVLLACKDKGKNIPELDSLVPLLDFMMTSNGQGNNVHPAARSEGQGIYWRRNIQRNFKEVLRYMYNPGIAHEAIYPASIRTGKWLPGSDLLTLSKPLWEQINSLKEPVVIRGVEYEEVTPDDFSGSYYVYKVKRLLVLMPYRGKPVLLSVSWQDGQSEEGRKGGILGQYHNWDFVYSKKAGATASGIGWMSTYMYGSSTITLLYPQEGGFTGYAMFKWLRAGWSGINVVKRKHIIAGADRTYSGMQNVFLGDKTTLPALEKMVGAVRGYDRATLLQKTAAYCKALAELSKKDEILSTDDFQEILQDGKYGENMADDNLRSLLISIELKRLLGKTVLGD